MREPDSSQIALLFQEESREVQIPPTIFSDDPDKEEYLIAQLENSTASQVERMLDNSKPNLKKAKPENFKLHELGSTSSDSEYTEVSRPKKIKKRSIVAEAIQAQKKVYPCPQCTHVLKSRSGLDIHLAAHEGKQFKCTQCNKVYRYKTSLRNHIVRNHLQRKFKCPNCEREFSDRSGLSKHRANCYS